MPDIHVLSSVRKGYWQVAFHFAIPNANNEVGVSYRTALVNSGLGLHPSGRRTVLGVGGVSPGPGQIHDDEESQLDTGQLFEKVAVVSSDGAISNAELLARVQTAHAELEAETIAELQDQLRYYGFTDP